MSSIGRRKIESWRARLKKKKKKRDEWEEYINRRDNREKKGRG
jgi:hypothetical protein